MPAAWLTAVQAIMLAAWRKTKTSPAQRDSGNSILGNGTNGSNKSNETYGKKT